ncbi:hypothetical protein BSKO_10164 [Bryopsis sp. KO-2023]|nr:hypothetical protein BSKO_10164 [Bryopsis sp. KO-2023]
MHRGFSAAFHFLLALGFCSSAISHSCDRAQSRQAQWILEEFLLPRMSKVRAQLPEDCPLDLSHNIFLRQEQHKRVVLPRTEKDIKLHKCGFCGKTFRAEHFLDNHLDFRHGNEILPNATSCLSDLCPILHCAYFFPTQSEDEFTHERRPPCDALLMQTRRMRCERIAHQCFPLALGEESHRLYEFIVHHFCETQHCDVEEAQEILKTLKPRKTSGGLNAWGVLLVVGLVVYYVGLYIVRVVIPEIHDHDD